MILKNIILMLIAGVLLTGCDNKDIVNPEKNNEQKSIAKENIEKSDLMSYKAKKGNLWLDIFNDEYDNPEKQFKIYIHGSKSFSEIAKGVEEYFNKFSDKNGNLNLKKFPSDLLYARFFSMAMISSKDDAINKYQEITNKLLNEKPVMPELDSTGKNFVDSKIAMARILEEYHNYYVVSEEYRLDNYAKAAHLHDQLKTAYKKYLQAKEDAFIAYGHLYSELHDAQKAELKAQGFDIAFNVFESLDQAQSIIDTINSTVGNHGDPKKFDKESFEQKITSLESVVNQLRLVKGKEDAIKRERLKDYTFDRYVDSYSGFIVECKIILRDISKGNIDSEVININKKYDVIMSNYNDVIN